MVFPSSHAICGQLASESVKAGLLLTAAWAISGIASRRSAAVRHHTWTLAIFGMLLLPLLRFALPAWNAPHGAPARLLQAAWSVKPTVSGITVNAIFEPAQGVHWTTWIAAIWLAGALLMLTRMISGLITLTRPHSLASPSFAQLATRCSQRLGLRRSVRVLIAKDAHVMPCTWGALHPRILLPGAARTWADQRLDMVLSHELAHIKRLDWPVRLVAETVRAILWFHPLVWLCASKLREESERACDDAVLASGTDANSYASELLDLVRNACKSPRAALAVAHPSNLERRFTSMLDPNVNRRRLTRKAKLFTSTAAILCLIPLASLRAPAEESSGELSGTVVDAQGAPVANATVMMTNTQTHTIRMTGTDATGTYRFDSLPAGDYERSVLKEGFSDYVSPQTLNSGAASSALTAVISPGESGHTEVPFAGLGRQKIGGAVAAANLIQQTPPKYPAEAKAAHIQGSVALKAHINKEGQPTSLRVANPAIDPALARAAIEAVSQWRYQLTLLNGDPVAIQTIIHVNFTLSE